MKKTAFPGYYLQTPTMPAITLLRRLLSEQDSSFHASEISISFLEEYINKNKLNTTEVISDLARKYNISGGQRNWSTTRKLMARSYIAQTYNIEETFFKELISEYKRYKNICNWVTQQTVGGRKENLDPYTQILTNLPPAKVKIFIDTPESKLIQYYRYLRVAIVHNDEDAFDRPVEYFKKQVQPYTAHFEQYYNLAPGTRLPAPNSPEQLSYRDHFMYTRCLKNLANLINNSCDLKGSEILEVVVKDAKFVSRMNGYDYTVSEKVKAKLEKDLSRYFTRNYGNYPSEIQSFVTAYYNWKSNV